jgi:hypothetical protein
LIEGDEDIDSKTIAGQEGRNSYGDQRAIRAETVEPELLSSSKRQPSSLGAANYDKDEEEDKSKNEAYDLNTYAERGWSVETGAC